MTIAKTINLQDSFLNQVRKENIPVIIYLVNGFQLRGAVKGFDNFTVIIENENKQQLVYKHAISTITPFRPLTSTYHDRESLAAKENLASVKPSVQMKS